MKKLVQARPDDTLRAVVLNSGAGDERMPVDSRQDPTKLLGLIPIPMHDICNRIGRGG
jgi:hypothetical protein